LYLTFFIWIGEQKGEQINSFLLYFLFTLNFSEPHTFVKPFNMAFN
jgi:hypothetical protein